MESDTEPKTETLHVDPDEDGVYVVESMCPQCQANGQSRMLKNKIPHFRDILVISFKCSECGYSNNESQSLASIQEHGEVVTLKVRNATDLDRQIVKSEFASIKIPSLDFEIPPIKQKEVVSTIQGIILQAVQGLQQSLANNDFEQSVRARIADVCVKLIDLADPDHIAEGNGYDFVIDDPAGNSYIESLTAPKQDPQLHSHKYQRTIEQTHAMGFYEEQSNDQKTEATGEGDGKAEAKPEGDAKAWDLSEPLPKEGNESAEATKQAIFPCTCGHCGKEGEQDMCLVDIPGFRACWVMAFNCQTCGFRSNEVKPAGAFGEKACRWTLTAENEEDLSRTVLKSDFAGVKFPSLDVELEPGTLGGVLTTVEGLLDKLVEEFQNKFPFVGDSQIEERKKRIADIATKLKDMASGKQFPFTMVIEDAADLSHIGARGDEIKVDFKAPAKTTEETKGAAPEAAAAEGAGKTGAGEDKGADDPQLKREWYERTAEQCDDLGLSQMKVDNY